MGLSAGVLEPALGVALEYEVDGLSEIFSFLLVGVECVFDEFGCEVVLLLDILDEGSDGHGFGGVVELLLDSSDFVFHFGVGYFVGKGVVVLVVEEFQDEVASRFVRVYQHDLLDSVYRGGLVAAVYAVHSQILPSLFLVLPHHVVYLLPSMS